jgi:hypothetical protein
MAYKVLGRTEELFRGHSARSGLEGPFVYGNGRILYYDPKMGQYWDPRSDFYVEQAEMDLLHADLLKMLGR